MVETVQSAKSGKRGAERLSPLETLCEEEQLLGVRHLGLLQVRVRLQPKLCSAGG